MSAETPAQIPDDEDAVPEGMNAPAPASQPRSASDTDDLNAPITLGILRRELRRELDPINSKLDHLIASNPHAAMTIDGRASALVGSPELYRDELEEAIVGGGMATWTYMRMTVAGTDTTPEENICLAVSCKHCALNYKLAKGRNPRLRGSYRFVSLPKELIDCGVKWVGLMGGHKYGPGIARRLVARDISIVILNNFPDNVNRDKVPLWPDSPEQRLFPSTLLVAGWSPTGTVHGSHCTKHFDHYVFVERSGEAGNSGTLMYLLRPGGQPPLLIGVYTGIDYALRKQDLDVLYRGEICPFPPVLNGRFKKHIAVPVADLPSKLRIKTSENRLFGTKTFDRVVSQDGPPYYMHERRRRAPLYGILVGGQGQLINEQSVSS